MSGLGELGGLPGFVSVGGMDVAQSDIDQYVDITVQNPVVDGSWIGTCSGTATAATAIVKKNILMDWPRNALYAVNGITNGTYGGTITASWLDQFGQAVTEKVAIGTAVNGGTTFGTAIVHKFLGGTYQAVASAGTFIGTFSVGVGTTAGTAGNYFGLLSKLGGTSDLKHVRWTNNGTTTSIGGGSLIGSLVNLTTHSFQGTSGVAITDSYTVVFKPSYDNTGKGTMTSL
jgi:hypothetical protein